MKKISDVANSPSIFVIFGVTGDLAAKKIIPSLWHLFKQGRLPRHISVIGFSRRNLPREEFKKTTREILLKRGGPEIKDEDFSRFFEIFLYHSGNFEDPNAFKTLSFAIADIESSWGVCANKLFYLAVPPAVYETIFKNLADVKLNIPCGENSGWNRVLIEKPFGTDLKSASKSQSLLSSYFEEKQIYRIDHYLFKEIIQGIENFRFSNNLFENSWDNTTIERIDIRLHESIGVEDRGSFYDAIGTLRDVGQNHLLEMLAALTMEYPQNMEADSTRQNRAKILGTLAPWTNETIRNNTYRAQYDGYKNIKGIRPGSQTETYFVLKTELFNSRWKGVEIFMEAGKRMAEARKEIVLTLKHPLICHLCEIGRHAPNKIIFRLEPNDEIIIHFWMKKPGFEQILEERTFSFFLYEKETSIQYVEEYAKILHAAMEGNQSLFVSPSEVEALWKFTDPIENAWHQNIVPLARYEPGTSPHQKIFEDEFYAMEGLAGNGTREIGIIGLGKMGTNLARRLHSKNWKVVGFNKSPSATEKLKKEGISGAYSLEELVGRLSKPRTVWLMVPAGKPVDGVIFGENGLTGLLSKEDTIIDGGNSFYKDSAARYKKLKNKGIHFIDAGVSGGPKGALEGASIMIGGDKNTFEKLEPLFRDLAAQNAYQFFEGSGMGHFVKMVHNGIEYGMMQALAEGFAIMKKYSSKLDLKRVANIYNHGSVIESRLVGWLKAAFEKYGQELKDVSGSVAHTGEGEWTVKTAKKLKVPVPVIKDSLNFRTASFKKPSYTGKILSALREQFGGHKVK